MSIIDRLPGGKELCDWFGEAPRFHDAEIIDLFLNRSGRSEIRLRTWKMTDNVGPDGLFERTKHVVVTIRVDEIADLRLEGFSTQNVIFGLTIDRVEDGYKIVLDPCYGLSGQLVARRVDISYEPGTPERQR